jgi:hypothetical protein
MARTTRVKRAPNREPTSLATSVPNIGVCEALDIDPVLTNSDINQPPEPPRPPEPPEPPVELDSRYPPLDSSPLNRYIYPPSPPLPPIDQQVLWSPTPTPPPPTPPAQLLLPPPIVVDDL